MPLLHSSWNNLDWGGRKGWSILGGDSVMRIDVSYKRPSPSFLSACRVSLRYLPPPPDLPSEDVERRRYIKEQPPATCQRLVQGLPSLWYGTQRNRSLTQYAQTRTRIFLCQPALTCSALSLWTLLSRVLPKSQSLDLNERSVISYSSQVEPLFSFARRSQCLLVSPHHSILQVFLIFLQLPSQTFAVV